jgi:hypothetical protein
MQRTLELRRRITGTTRTTSSATIAFAFLCAAAGLAYASQDRVPPRSPSLGRDSALEARWRSALRDRRESMIDLLHAYWTSGDFVQNPDPAGGPGHFLLDGRGKPCPLASIIIESGDRGLIEDAARRNNGAMVADLTEGPLLSWILRSGLTQEECILIQRPSLSGDDLSRVVRPQEKRKLASDLEQVERSLRANSEQGLASAARRLVAVQRARNSDRF